MISIHVFNATDIEIHHSIGLEKIQKESFSMFNLGYVLLSDLFLGCSVEEKGWTKCVPVLPENIVVYIYMDK